MITVPVETIEKPLTAIDYCAALQACASVDEVRQFGDECPMAIRQDERFARAVAQKLAAIHEKKRAA